MTVHADLGHPGTSSRGLSALPSWEERAFDRSCLAFEARAETGGAHEDRRPRDRDPGLPNGAGPVNTSEDQEGDKASDEVTAGVLGRIVVWLLAGDQGWPQGSVGRGHLFCPSPLRSLCLDPAKGLSLDRLMCFSSCPCDFACRTAPVS